MSARRSLQDDEAAKAEAGEQALETPAERRRGVAGTSMSGSAVKVKCLRANFLSKRLKQGFWEHLSACR